MIAGGARSGEFYTYIHTRADDGKVFYVGKGKGDRAHRRSGRSLHWQSVTKKHGIRVDIVAQWSSEVDAFEHEKFLIACFRDMGHPICNMTDGGEGMSGRKPSHETRAKISASHMGLTVSDETRRKIGDANRGRPRSPEAHQKIIAAQTGLKRSPETCKRMSKAQAGRVVSEEARAKIAAALTGRKRDIATLEKLRAIANSPERRAKQSVAMKGRPWSEARRAAQKKENP